MFDQSLLKPINACPYTGFEEYFKDFYKLEQFKKLSVDIFISNDAKTVRVLYKSDLYAFLEGKEARKYVSGLLLNRLHGSKIYDIVGVYTEPEYRRQGLAKGLLVVAKMCFKDVRHSDCLTELGQKFARV